MTNTNITNFRKNLFEYVDQAVMFGDVVNVSTKNGNAVILSEADYNSLLETLHLCSIPGMVAKVAVKPRKGRPCILQHPLLWRNQEVSVGHSSSGNPRSCLQEGRLKGDCRTG